MDNASVMHVKNNIMQNISDLILIKLTQAIPNLSDKMDFSVPRNSITELGFIQIRISINLKTNICKQIHQATREKWKV